MNRILSSIAYRTARGLTLVKGCAKRFVSSSVKRARSGLVARGGFDRELNAVVAGQAKHQLELEARSGKGAEYTLRRNLHRIEKGLIMRPLRDVFALEYIDETCKVFEAVARENRTGCKGLLDWGGSVLTRYFDVVAETPKTLKARESFLSGMEALTGGCTGNSAPYIRDLKPLSITIEDMQALALRRRSVRWFLPDPPSREMVDKAIDVARYSPSACNRQPFRFLLFDDRELVQQVASIPMGTSGLYQNFPAICVLLGDLSAFPNERDRHVPYIDASLAAMAFEFALEVQGIASCSINWPEIDKLEKQMADLLRLEPYERPIMLIAYGWPDPEGKVPFSQKMPLDEIRSYNSLPRRDKN